MKKYAFPRILNKKNAVHFEARPRKWRCCHRFESSRCTLATATKTAFQKQKQQQNNFAPYSDSYRFIICKNRTHANGPRKWEMINGRTYAMARQFIQEHNTDAPFHHVYRRKNRVRVATIEFLFLFTNLQINNPDGFVNILQGLIKNENEQEKKNRTRLHGIVWRNVQHNRITLPFYNQRRIFIIKFACSCFFLSLSLYLSLAVSCHVDAELSLLLIASALFFFSACKRFSHLNEALAPHVQMVVRGPVLSLHAYSRMLWITFGSRHR